jgi:peptidoglycan/LPS O-acetylase OafA/YrhL
MPGTQRFVVLDSFRGLAALAVVLFHMPVLLAFSELNFFCNSYLFVQFFFVLSGFVMCHTYSQRLGNGAAWRRFLLTRTLRLYPLHLFMLGVIVLLEGCKWLAASQGLGFNHETFSGKTAPGELLPNLLLLQAWLPNANSLSFNLPSWSISVEYYLYLLFGLVLLRLPRWANGLFLAICLLSFWGWLIDFQALKLDILKGASGFFAGVLLYRLYHAWRGLRPSRLAFTVLEITCLLMLGLVIDSLYLYRDYLVVWLFCLTILVFAFEGGACSQWLKGRALQALGQRSYSIYMTHFAVLWVLKSLAMVLSKLLDQELTLMQPEPLTGEVVRYISTHSVLFDNLLVLATVLGVILVSMLTYRYVELPGIALGRRLLSREPEGRIEDEARSPS